jgi:hypothetical protein
MKSPGFNTQYWKAKLASKWFYSNWSEVWGDSGNGKQWWKYWLNYGPSWCICSLLLERGRNEKSGERSQTNKCWLQKGAKARQLGTAPFLNFPDCHELFAVLLIFLFSITQHSNTFLFGETTNGRNPLLPILVIYGDLVSIPFPASSLPTELTYYPAQFMGCACWGSES